MTLCWRNVKIAARVAAGTLITILQGGQDASVYRFWRLLTSSRLARRVGSRRIERTVSSIHYGYARSALKFTLV